MPKRKTYITLLFIFLLAFFAGNFSYPNYFNKGVDSVNWFLREKIGSETKIQIPRFSEIPFKLGLDLQGGTHLVYEADLSDIAQEDYASSMQGLRDVIERRVNVFGVREPLVQTQESEGHWRLIIELAGISDTNEAIKMIGQTPFLEFREQRPEEETKKIIDKQKELEGMTLEEAQKVKDWELALQDPYFIPTSLTGKYLKKTAVVFDQTTSKPEISLQFNDEGTSIFKALTGANVGKPLAIYIDNVLISAPVVQEAIEGGKAQITGNFTIEEAKKLARDLNAGALPVPINLISQQTIGPTLGTVSLQQSLKAGVIGFIAVIVFMIVFYRFLGLLASLALVIYIALNLALFKIIPVTLTLSGIGGFILSIGMAVDANVLIFARMHEEMKDGKGFLASVEDGFRRAWPSIRDGNFTTLIVAAILFSFGTSFVKGFAMTLGIGIMLSMFSAIVITKSFFKVFVGTKLEKAKWLWK